MANPTESTTHLNHTDEAKEEAFNYALQLASSSVLPMALKTAMDLGIFEIIAKAGPPGTKLSASQIVAELPARNPDAALMLDRILRLLACHEVLGCSVDAAGLERSYSLNPVSQYFVQNQDGVSLCPLMALMQDKVFFQSWYQLKNAVLEGGIPFDMVYGMQPFEYSAIDPRFNQVFNEAMFNFTTIIIKKLLESYKGFKHLKQLVDVGGGLGQTLKAITSMYHHIKGINFDLPHVIEHAPLEFFQVNC
uniref:Eugenol O-methyltransferase family protein n=2 Tax=Rhizophora mucronata TaxID=61149 RepID=A0A2P2J140_RHIMU